jgi:hypothetical protein
MSNAILPSAALDRRASPVMPLFTRGALASRRYPGGGAGSPSAVVINSLADPRLATEIQHFRGVGNGGVRAVRVAARLKPIVEVVLRCRIDLITVVHVNALRRVSVVQFPRHVAIPSGWPPPWSAHVAFRSPSLQYWPPLVELLARYHTVAG